MMSTGRCSDLSSLIAGFFNESLDINERLLKGRELYTSLGNATSDKEVQEFVHVICENASKLLTSTDPQNIQENPMHQLRRLCLEIFQKLPNGDHLRPYARSLLVLLFKLVEVENEENVLICIKLIIDLHKYYRPSFSMGVSYFLEFVRRVYRGLQDETEHIFQPICKLEVRSIADVDVDELVTKTFTTTKVYTQEPVADGSLAVYNVLPKSFYSLRVMQEIPILFVLMYQLFKQHIHQGVSEFIPLIMDFINLKPTDDQRRSPHFSQDVFIDFMAAQVKTLSFLAYVIKIYQDVVERYSVNLVQGMMNLLINCPPSVTNMRKEFFIAARHILSAQEIRPKFLDVLDKLMNEDILIGQGYTVRDALRPLAYSTLADLIHHIRSELSLTKIARAIDLYGRNMHDDTLPFSIQQMSLRLLLNLVECIRQRIVTTTTSTTTTSSASDVGNSANGGGGGGGLSSGAARRLLLQTARLCVLKCRVVAEHYLPVLESTCQPESEDSVSTGSAHGLPSMVPPSSGLLNASLGSGDTTLSGLLTDAEKVSLQLFPTLSNRTPMGHMDLRSLVKALMTGMRTIVTSLLQCPRGLESPNGHKSISVMSPGGAGHTSPRSLSASELSLLAEYFIFGMRMIDIVQIVSRDGKLCLRKRSNQPSAKSPDERLLIETFAFTFVQLSPISFQEIFSSKIHDYVQWCRQSPSYTNLALHLLSQPSKTCYFCNVLLSYLVDRLEQLGDGTDESVLYMRLLKLCFSSVKMSGTENENVMKLYLRRIVQGSMQFCLTAQEPTAYLTLLRTLFRSIGGGEHDKLYREFFPLLPDMLSTLNRLLRSPHRTSARDLLGELCVIVPVRLSTLLPYLSLLMEPLVYVLNCNTVNQGLRTLELCVDNMQPDFLHDHLYQVRGDMLLALYNSLHSASESVQKMAFKVLGKLGRFNRTNLTKMLRLRLDPVEGLSGPQLRFYLTEFKQQPIELPVCSLVDAAIEVLQDSTVDQPTKSRAWSLLQSILVASLDLPPSSLSASKPLDHGQQHQADSSSSSTSTGTNSPPVDPMYACLQQTDFLRSARRLVLLQSRRGVDELDRSTTPDRRPSQGAHRLLFQPNCCRSVDEDVNRPVVVRALAGLFLSGLTPAFREAHGHFVAYLVRHLTLVSIACHVRQRQQQFGQDHQQQPSEFFACHGTSPVDSSAQVKPGNTPLAGDGSQADETAFMMQSGPSLPNFSSVFALDPCLLVDALLFAMGHEEKQLSQLVGGILLPVVHSTAITVFTAAAKLSLNDDEKLEPELADVEEALADRVARTVAQLPIFQHFAHLLVDMFHHSAWYVKWGACASLIYLLRLLHPSWLTDQPGSGGGGGLVVPLLRGLFYAIHELAGQLSQGALGMARDCARLLVRTAFSDASKKVSSDEQQSSAMNILVNATSTSGPSAVTPKMPGGRLGQTGSPVTPQPAGKQPMSSPEQRRRSTPLRRGCSAGSVEEPDQEPEETDNSKSRKHAATGSSAAKSSPDPDACQQDLGEFSRMESIRQVLESRIPLLGPVLTEILEALLSNTIEVRQEARHLLRLLSQCLGKSLVPCLTVMLAPYWGDSRLGKWLFSPHASTFRLLDLPMSTQLAILEAVHFLVHSESTSAWSEGETSADCSCSSLPSVVSGRLGAGLFRFDLSRESDRCFLADVRSLLLASLPTPCDSPTGTASAPTSSCPASPGRSGLNGPNGKSTTTTATATTTTTSFGNGTMSVSHQRLLVDLRSAACRVLSLTWYLDSQKSLNMSALFRGGICCDNEQIREAAFVSLKDFTSRTSIDIELRHASVKPILQNIRQPTAGLRLSTARQLSYCAQLFPSTFSERLCDAIYTHLNTLIDCLVSKQNVSALSIATSPGLELCAVLIDLFHIIPLATAKHVVPLIDLVIRAEQSLSTEFTSPLRPPLVRFLARYPAETCMQMLTNTRLPQDDHAQRIFLFLIECPHGQPIVDYLMTNSHLLCDLIRPTELYQDHHHHHGHNHSMASTSSSSLSMSGSSLNAGSSFDKLYWLPRVGGPLTVACPRHLALRVVHSLHRQQPSWLLSTTSSSGQVRQQDPSPQRSTRTRYGRGAGDHESVGVRPLANSDHCYRRQSLVGGDIHCHPVVSALLAYWQSEAFSSRQASLTLVTLAGGQIAARHDSGPTQPQKVVSLDSLSRMPRSLALLHQLVEIDDRQEAGRQLAAVLPSVPAAFHHHDDDNGGIELDIGLVADVSSSEDALVTSGTAHSAHWDEPRLILDCLLDCAKAEPTNFDLLFTLVIGVNRLRSVACLQPLRVFLDQLATENNIEEGRATTTPVTWYRQLFLAYVDLVHTRLRGHMTSPTSGMGSPEPGAVRASPEDMHHLLAHLVLPCLTRALHQASGSSRQVMEQLMGGPARPTVPDDSDLAHLFVSVLLPDPVVSQCSEIRVMYYQLASLLTHFAPDYICQPGHSSDARSYRLRQLIALASPCLTSSLSVVDLQEKYTGLQLLAHLIANFQVVNCCSLPGQSEEGGEDSRRSCDEGQSTPVISVGQVFQCLAKGTHTETKKIVNPALDVLLPAWIKTYEQQKLLVSYTRKVMLEDHGIQSCIHILGIIVRHSDLYFAVRHQILPHIIAIISRLSVQQLPVEQRRLALDMIYTAAKWDHKCRQSAVTATSADTDEGSTLSTANQLSRPVSGDAEADSQSRAAHQMKRLENDSPMEKTHCDQLLNLMIRFTCQAVDTGQNGSLSDAQVLRCLTQLEFTIRSDVWGGEACELRLAFLDRHLAADDLGTNSAQGIASSAGATASGATPGNAPVTPTNTQSGSSASASAVVGTPGSVMTSLGLAQTTNILMTLEVLRILFAGLESPTLLANVKHFSGAICSLLARQLTNLRIIRSCSSLLKAMLQRFPADASHRQKITTVAELFDIYSAALKAIQDSFNQYSENGSKPNALTRLQSAFQLFSATQVSVNSYAFVDRCIVQLIKLLHRLVQEVISSPSCLSSGSLNLGSGSGGAAAVGQDTTGVSAQLTDLLINSLEVIKSRLNVVSNEMRKNAFGPDLCLIMDKAKDHRLFRAVIKILREWINVPKSEEHFAPTAREKVNFFYRLWQAYPRWSVDNPEIAREILDCVHEVYVSGALFKNHDLYVKLEQAFCCSMLCPFPDIRERFVSLFLEASQIQYTTVTQPVGVRANTADPGGDNTGGSADPESDPTGSGPAHPQVISTSLVVRLLFLLVSCSWDEAHVRDNFWLALFFDVLLCDVDASLPPLLSPISGHFPTVDTGLPGASFSFVESSTRSKVVCSDAQLTGLLQLQSIGLRDAQRVTSWDGLRGLLCLAHRSPALTTQLFGQLWPQLWNRLLLRGTSSSGLPADLSSQSIVSPVSLTNTIMDALTTTTTTQSALSFAEPQQVDHSSAPACMNDSVSFSLTSQLTAQEVRAFVLPQLIYFLASEQHIHLAEPHLSPLGAFLSGLMSMPDTLLVHLPLPTLTYIAINYNQWYPMALFLETLCARAGCSTEGCHPTDDLVYCLPIAESAEHPGGPGVEQELMPSRAQTALSSVYGCASLSLIALYDAMSEVDHLVVAWFYRLGGGGADDEASLESRRRLSPPPPLLRCLQLAQYGHLLRALEASLDHLATVSPHSLLACFSSVDPAANTTGSGTFGSSTPVVGSGNASQCASPIPGCPVENIKNSGGGGLIHSVTAQLCDHMNRSRLQEYCFRYLRQLGQWDTLESLATNASAFFNAPATSGGAGSASVSVVSTSSAPTSSSFQSSPAGSQSSSNVSATAALAAAATSATSGFPSTATAGTSASNATGVGGSVSAYWGLRADAAWRRSDWPEVYSSLAGFANECPRSELLRYALIQGASCVAGRRTPGFAANAAAAAVAAAAAASAGHSESSDPYSGAGAGSSAVDSTPSVATTCVGPTTSQPSSSVSASVASSVISGGGGSSSTAMTSSINNMFNLIHTSELESLRVLTIVCREWRRLPMLVTGQHVPLLQIAHRAVEITEGNSLLAQYCGHVLSNPSTLAIGTTTAVGGGVGVGGLQSAVSAAYSSSSTGQQQQQQQQQTVPVTSSCGGPGSTSGGSGAGSGVSIPSRMPLSHALHDYKTVFKSWQSRCPSLGDDLSFWHDLHSWRQVVSEGIMSCYPCMPKTTSDRTNLLAMCERELASSQLQLARAARKHRCPSLAQQHLDRYTRLNLPPSFEKTKQEIKLKLADLRKEELLEGLELMEKTNIQQFERKDRAKFFCYKALFFSHFNKGDEATKNFGYGTQMQDNIYQVWSIYGDFLENVYSSYPPAKREVAASTTGLFAMQALMEAVSIVGSGHRSRNDLAKCLWLLTLDDEAGPHLLARTFEERAIRVRSEAFLAWLPSLVVSLMRPEGRFVGGALRSLVTSHPTVLYAQLRGLQHQLTAEASYDARLGRLAETSAGAANLFRQRIQALAGQHDRMIAAAAASRTRRRESLAGRYTSSSGTASAKTADRSTGSASTSLVTSPVLSKKKKRVIVVMRGVEGERLGSSPMGQQGSDAGLQDAPQTPTMVSSTMSNAKKVVIRNLPDSQSSSQEMFSATEDVELEEDDEEEVETETPVVSVTDDIPAGPEHSDGNDPANSTPAPDQTGELQDQPVPVKLTGTGCLSSTVGESLHRINVLIQQLRRRHPARLYLMDVFTTEVGGYLQPTWAEQLLAQISSVLSQLHRLLWLAVIGYTDGCGGQTATHLALAHPKQLIVPSWLASHLTQLVNSYAVAGVDESRDEVEGEGSKRGGSGAQDQGEGDLMGHSPRKSSRHRKTSQQQQHSSDDRAPPLGATSSQPPAVSGVESAGGHQLLVFDEVSRLSTERRRQELVEDPEFHTIHSRLTADLGNIEQKTVLQVIQQLTRRWLPLLEGRISRLPTRCHLADYGARRLVELPQIVTSITGTAGAGSRPGVDTSCHLELPGEWNANMTASNNPSGSSSSNNNNSSTGCTGNSPTSTTVALDHWLTIAEVLPQVGRVVHSPGHHSPPARRLALRASNGRLFFYDLACPPGMHSPVDGNALPGWLAQELLQVQCPSVVSTGGGQVVRPVSLAPLTGGDGSATGLPAYVSWRRRAGPGPLFHMVNDLLASQPETAKRQLSLVVPRSLEVGPLGLCLTETGSSVSASSVVNACSNPLPTANPVTSRGLTGITHCPPSALASALVDESQLRMAGCPAWAQSFGGQVGQDSVDQQQADTKPFFTIPPPPSTPSLIPTGGPFSSNPTVNQSYSASSSAAGGITTGGAAGSGSGSAGVASEALGRPTGLDAGCYPSCETLLGIAAGATVFSPQETVCLHLEQVLAEMDRCEAEMGRLGIRQGELLRLTAYRRLTGGHSGLHTAGGLFARFGTASESEDNAGILRRWASYRVVDAESYWLLRQRLAYDLGLLGLVEQVCQLTALHPGQLLIDPRSGRAEARHLLFELPATASVGSPAAAATAAVSSSTSSPAAAAIALFVRTMALQHPDSRARHSVESLFCQPTDKSSSSDTAPNTIVWQMPARPSPFRLTPHLAGFLCPPGVPREHSPLAAGLVTAAQALASPWATRQSSSGGGQQSPLASLLRTLLRSDFILWHRGWQAAVHAHQLTSAVDGCSCSPVEAQPRLHKKRQKRDEDTGHDDGDGGELVADECGSTLVPELTNEHLIQLVSLCLDAVNSKLKALTDVSGSEPVAWFSIQSAVSPENLAQMDPSWLPWL